MKKSPSHSRSRTTGGAARPGGTLFSGTRGLLVGVFAIALAAAGARVLFLLQLGDTPFFLHHFSDSRLYMQLARDIAFGDGIPRAYFMSPLYPHLVAVVWKLTGNPELWMRVLQTAFGVVSALLTARIAERFAGRAAALATGLLTALYAPLVFYDGLLLTESLQTLLLTAHLLLLLTAMDRRHSAWWAAAGAALGLAAITRANVLLFLPVFLLAWMFVTSIRRRGTAGQVGLYAGMSLLMLVPTTWHNAAEEGVFLPVTASSGYNLYAGNNPEADGFYTMPDPVDLYTDPNGEGWVEQRTGREMNSAEVSAWWRDRALEWMRDHPGRALELIGQKLLLFFHPVEVDQLGLSLGFFSAQYGALPAIPSALFPVLLILAFAGFAVMLRTGGSAAILPLFLATFTVAHALFFVSGRLRLPIMPLLIAAACVGVVIAVRTLRAGKTQASAPDPRAPGEHLLPANSGSRFIMAVGAVVAGLVLLLQPPVSQSFAQEYLKLGQLSFEEGDYAGAERMFRASLEEKRTVDGLTNLANTFAATDRPAEAADLYRAALAQDSTAALAWFNYGNLWMQNGKPRYAYGAWKKAVELQPRLAAAHRNLGLLLFQAGRLEEALSHLEDYMKWERDPEKRREITRDITRIRELMNTGP